MSQQWADSDEEYDLKISWKHKEDDDEDGSPRTVADLPVERTASPLQLPIGVAPPSQLPVREGPSAYTLKAARMRPRPHVPNGSVLLVVGVLLSAITLMPERQHPPAPSPPPTRRCLNYLTCWAGRPLETSRAKRVKSQPRVHEPPATQLAPSMGSAVDGACWSVWNPIEPGMGLGLAPPIAPPVPMPRKKTPTSSTAVDTHCDGWDASMACRSGWPMPYLLNPALMLALHA